MARRSDDDDDDRPRRKRRDDDDDAYEGDDRPSRRRRRDSDADDDDNDRPRSRRRREEDAEETPEEREKRLERKSRERKAAARGKLAVPATFILVLASLHIALASLGVLLSGVRMLEAGDIMVGWNGPRIPPVVHMGHALYIIGAQAFMAIGAICMMRGSSFGIALLTAFLSVIPCCCSSCGIFGIPFGIWALVVLSDEDVQSVFH